MKIRHYAAIVLSLSVPLVSWLAPAAKADGIGGLTASQLQRFSRDLVPSSSQDFFRQGREQLEREIQRLDRPVRNSNELLRVEPQTQSQGDRAQNVCQQSSTPKIGKTRRL
ncbi:hypothetical protein C7B65_21490 [Phormidesmis priestleyi ULC007]|uniref:Uncharacterized protein n=1 Tax=Phormidesmis priestleyi ULC007 TaxID=1920490 RepID=A0A2T1D7R9_9CYAN|nr:hypothetical protein [Phormidesmis priestleyi]PSB16496.1 hypothetical protein C7B65_21490 [Phormidesmis priestleyi ULC007]PZO48563.1 MAG: hypothetical protein DCF14_16490 [Phormidesmis priestleyi]